VKWALRATSLALVGLALIGVACGDEPGPVPPPASPSPEARIAYETVPSPPVPAKGRKGRRNEPAPGVRLLAEPLDRFALALLSLEAAAAPEGNVVLSPASVHDALTMTLNGARGSTALEMRESLGIDRVGLARADQAWADLIAYLHEKKDAEIRVANSLWLKDEISFSPAFLSTNHDYFAADAQSLPADLKAAASAINGWVEKRTGGRITELVSEGSLDLETVAVLVNTLYVKAGWRDELFDEKDTRPEPFTLPSKSKVDVPMMHAAFCGQIASTPEYDAVPVPANGQVDVTVVVPKGDQTPESVVGLLQQRGLESLREHTRHVRVDLSLPRFEARFHDSLAASLQHMGMSRAFTPGKADFSGITEDIPLSIDDVVHEAVLEVNERGVEAAAGTAVTMGRAMAKSETVTIRADRPFMVVLGVGSCPHLPLFTAIVRDPR
jgi:serpin B